MKPRCTIPSILALGTALALIGCTESTTLRRSESGDGTRLRDAEPTYPQMEKKSPQTLEDVKRNTENPASGAIIIAPPMGEGK
ncbi:MAG: hypothetical protein ACM3SV_05370 [Betaproteobacteria bacterium]